MRSLEILFCDNHLLAAVKPAGLLTQPDETGKESFEAALKAFVKERYEKPGAVFLHAIHRLDRVVSGIVLFARTSKALSRLNEQVRAQEIQRVYVAEVEGILEHKEAQLDHFLAHRNHRAEVVGEKDPEAKHARLRYTAVSMSDKTTRVEIELDTGRYHQIRAQFSAIGHPIVGDVRYGAAPISGEGIHLHSAKIAFLHPVTKEKLVFSSSPAF